MRSMKGFTLIELLIVVAIIAILAAIAVPNFLEAQTRAKVARVAGDLRTISIGMEAYFVDRNTYPGDQDNDPNSGEEENNFNDLTTPIAYLSSVGWRDPFNNERLLQNTNTQGYAPIYQLASGADAGRRAFSQNLEVIQAYAIYSLGPDEKETFTNDDWPYRENIGEFYDPTNGTVSDGEIVRFGGDYQNGGWSIGSAGLWYNWGSIKATYP